MLKAVVLVLLLLLGCPLAQAEEGGAALPPPEHAELRPGHGGEAEDPEALAALNAAELAVRKGEIEGALEQFQQFDKEWPLHPKAPYVATRIAELQAQLALREQAAKLLKEIGELGDQPALQARARAKLAALYLANRKPADALQVYEQILKENPHTYEALQAPSRIAALLETQGEIRKALETYQKAYESFDERLRAYLARTADQDADVVNAGYLANRARMGAAETKTAMLRKIAALAERAKELDAAEEAKKGLAKAESGADPFGDRIERAGALLERAKEAEGTERDHLRQLALFECLAVLEFPPYIPARAKGALPENEAQISKARRGATVKQLAKAVGMVVGMEEEEPRGTAKTERADPSRSAGATSESDADGGALGSPGAPRPEKPSHGAEDDRLKPGLLYDAAPPPPASKPPGLLGWQGAGGGFQRGEVFGSLLV